MFIETYSRNKIKTQCLFESMLEIMTKQKCLIYQKNDIRLKIAIR